MNFWSHLDHIFSVWINSSCCILKIHLSVGSAVTRIWRCFYFVGVGDLFVLAAVDLHVEFRDIAELSCAG